MPGSRGKIDQRLAELLPRTVAGSCSRTASQLSVVASRCPPVDLKTLPVTPTAFVANLPYNVAVPIVPALLGELRMCRMD